MGLFDIFKKQAKEEPKKKDELDLEIYSGMRVEVTSHDGQLLFVAKLVGPHGGRAELSQYSEADVPESEDPLPVRIRGYHDWEKKAVYMEGDITPGPHHVWKVENLVIARIGNDRAFFRLSTDLPATATTFGGFGAGEKPCRLLNISVGGACIGSEVSYREGDKFLLKVKLLEDRDISAMYCQVLRIIDKGDSRYEYGCRFLEVTEADQEKITQNIFAIQRKQRGRY